MNLYFAIASNRADNKILFSIPHKYYLFSYYYYRGDNGQKILNEFDFYSNQDIFLDSGAFSAYTLKKPINLDEYIRYIQKYNIKYYASLDVIGDPQKTHDNLIYMQKKGLNPIPTFHMGEPIEWLDKILDSEYIALGGMVKSEGIEDWLDKVFNYIYKKRSDIKIHGFGLTNPNMILKYPWYSVDSSSWAGCVRFARFSWWNNGRHKFDSLTAAEFFEETKVPYEEGEPIINEKREIIIQKQAEHFLMMDKHLKRKKDVRDYSYITAQNTLF